MPKIPKFTSHTELKNQVKQKIKSANDYISDKVKESATKAANWVDDKINDPSIKEKAQKASDWTSDRIDDAKDTYEKIKQKYAEFTMDPPKLEVLGKKVTELQKQVLFKSTFLGELKHRAPQETMLIFQKEKELMQLEQKTQKAIEEYNRFAAKQAAIQRAFDELNKAN